MFNSVIAVDSNCFAKNKSSLETLKQLIILLLFGSAVFMLFSKLVTSLSVNCAEYCDTRRGYLTIGDDIRAHYDIKKMTEEDNKNIEKEKAKKKFTVVK